METITIEQFSSIVLVTGHIISVDSIPESQKMLRFSIDIGEPEPRTILSGIGQHYTLDELRNKRCVVVANLTPRPMLGFVSNGMLICTTHTDDEGNEVVRIVEPTSGVPIGTRLS